MTQLNKASVASKETVNRTRQGKGYNRGGENETTSEVVEFDVGLGTISKEFGFIRVKINGLSEEFHRQLKVVFHKCLFGFRFEIRSH